MEETYPEKVQKWFWESPGWDNAWCALAAAVTCAAASWSHWLHVMRTGQLSKTLTAAAPARNASRAQSPALCAAALFKRHVQRRAALVRRARRPRSNAHSEPHRWQPAGGTAR